jgi:hypothetical protein
MIHTGRLLAKGLPEYLLRDASPKPCQIYLTGKLTRLTTIGVTSRMEIESVGGWSHGTNNGTQFRNQSIPHNQS